MAKTQKAAKTAKNESPFYVMRTFQKVTDNANQAFNDYNEKVIKKAMESGKGLVDDVRKNTVVVLEGVKNDSLKVIARIPVMENAVKEVPADEGYYVVKTVQKATEQASSAFAEYNEKVVKKAVTSGKEMVEDVRKNTAEAMEGVLADGRKVISLIPMLEAIAPKAVEGVDEEAGYYVVKTYKKAQDTAAAAVKEYNEVLKKTLESYREYAETMGKKTVENGKGFAETAEKTAKEVAEGLTADAKLVSERVTGRISAERDRAKKFAETKIEGGLAVVTKAMDLPTRKDIQALTRAMKALDKKVDALIKA